MLILKAFAYSNLINMTFNDGWIQMIQDNTVSILGWIKYEKVKWLQNNNPEVPGIVYKLTQEDEKARQPVYDSARRQGYEIWKVS